MIKNVIVASTNLWGLFTLPYCTYYESFALLGAMISSILYHLIEHHKHGMSGIPNLRSELVHEFFLDLDRIFAVFAAIIFINFNWDRVFDPYVLVVGLIGLVSSVLSEIVFKHPRYQTHYIVTHCIWHICAFHGIYLLKVF